MAHEIDDVIKKHIKRACAERRDMVSDPDVFENVVLKIVAEARSHRDSGQINETKLVGFLKQLEAIVETGRTGGTT